MSDTEHQKIIAIDLGKEVDFSVITVVDPIYTDDGSVKYHVPYIEILPLKTRYADVARRANEIATKLGRECHVVLDKTGVGNAIFEMFQTLMLDLDLIGVTITGGKTSKGWNVPKEILIRTLQNAYQTQVLRISSRLPADILNKLKLQMMGFNNDNIRKTLVNDDKWKIANHDDIVLSLAIGTYVAARLYPPAVGE